MISSISVDQHIASLRAALSSDDPEAKVVYDPFSGVLSVRSRFELREVARVAAGLGFDLAASFPDIDLRQRGTDCCGGCSG
jgi:hypothetical protein